MPVLQGDFGGLEDLQARIRKITQPGFKEAIARRLTGTVIKLLADQFRASRDPYGNPWKPPMHRKGKPLLDTGRLRAAAVGQTARQESGSVVRVVIPVEYASYLQDGTRRMARRQIVPDRAGGLGPTWTGAMRKEIEKAVQDHVKPGGGKGGAH